MVNYQNQTRFCNYISIEFESFEYDCDVTPPPISGQWDPQGVRLLEILPQFSLSLTTPNTVEITCSVHLQIERLCRCIIFFFLVFASILQMCGSLTSKVARLYGTQRVLGVRNAQTSYVTTDVTILVPWFLRVVMCFVSSNKLRRLLAPENIVSLG